VKLLVQSGPDASGTPIICGEDATNTTGTAAGQYGFYNCVINNAAAPGLGKTGTDTATAWVDLNNNNVVDGGEPQQSGITVQWVPPAPQNATVALVCSPNATNAAGTVCQDDPTQDKTATFTATVTNNNTVPATPAAGVVVNFGVAQSAGAADAGDTETLSVSSCTTDSSGKCSTVFTDSSPVDGEGFTVTASVPLAVGGPAQATAVKNFHTATANEARNIAITPAKSTQPSGGAQTLTAKVTDRFGNPVSGVGVTWSETGPGGFRSATTCTTASAGTCSVDVTSLSSEQGDETITATITGSNSNSECASPAGFSNYTSGSGAGPGTANPTIGGAPNATGQNNAAPGTTAGNCSGTATVTWQPSTNGAASVTVSAPNGTVGHLLTASATVKDANGAAVANAVVSFSVQGSNNASGSSTTNASGVATFSYTPRNAGADTITAIVNNGANNPSASKTVTIGRSAPAKHHIAATINCKSPRKHVLRCVVRETPKKRGLSVGFYRKGNNGPIKLGTARTNSNGVAIFIKKGFRSHLRMKVFARVSGSGTTFPARTGAATVVIK